jgi:hypothetical protein
MNTTTCLKLRCVPARGLITGWSADFGLAISPVVNCYPQLVNAKKLVMRKDPIKPADEFCGRQLRAGRYNPGILGELSRMKTTRFLRGSDPWSEVTEESKINPSITHWTSYTLMDQFTGRPT